MYLSGELVEAPDGGHLLRAAGQEGVPGGEPGRESSTSRQHVGKSRVGDDRDGGTRVKVHSDTLSSFLRRSEAAWSFAKHRSKQRSSSDQINVLKGTKDIAK